MPQAYAIVGIKEKKNQPELIHIQNTTKGICKTSHMKVLQQSKFKLGSLDSMLLNLERVKKIEQAATNFLKRTVKMYQEIVPDKDLFDNKLDSNVAPRSIDNYLKNFEWDDVRFPRSASLFDQIKNIEEKLNNIEKNLKIKYQNYQDSKTTIQNNFDKKESLNNFINKDPNDIIYDLLSSGKCKLKPSDFIFTDYLQSFIVYIPEQELDNFQDTYESLNDQIVPGSFGQISKKYGYVMGQIVAFKLAQDDIKIQFKSKLKTFVKEFQLDQRKAKENAEQKQSIMSQNKTDKDLLESACKDSFKRTMVMIIHVHMYLVVIDSSLRFGSFDNFGVFLMFFDAGKKPRIIQKLISRYAEKDKAEFYGTKEQLNDVEDFFPFVWTDFTLKIQQNLSIKNENLFFLIMSNYKKKSILQLENLTSQEIKRRQDQKEFFRQTLLDQIKENRQRKQQQQKQESKENKILEDKIKRQFKQIGQQTEQHFKSVNQKSKNFNSSGSHHENNSMSSSNQKTINTSLSKKYVEVNKNGLDLNTITEKNNKMRPNLQYQNQQDDQNQELEQLKRKLQKLQKIAKQKIFEKEKSQQILFQQKKKLIQIQNDIQRQKLQENNDNLFTKKQQNFSNQNIQMNVETQFVPMEQFQQSFVNQSFIRKTLDKCDRDLDQLDQLIENYQLILYQKTKFNFLIQSPQLQLLYINNLDKVNGYQSQLVVYNQIQANQISFKKGINSSIQSAKLLKSFLIPKQVQESPLKPTIKLFKTSLSILYISQLIKSYKS